MRKIFLFISFFASLISFGQATNPQNDFKGTQNFRDSVFVLGKLLVTSIGHKSSVGGTDSLLIRDINGSVFTIATSDLGITGGSLPASTALGDLLVGDGSDFNTVLGIGTTGQILRAGESPFWDDQYPSFTSNAGKYLKVNATEDGVEWATVTGGSGVTGVGTYNSNGPFTEGATIVGSNIQFGDFTATEPGMVPHSNGSSLEFLTGNGAWTLGTTVGKNVLTLTNPSALGYIRVNADNTVTHQSYANVRTDLGLVIGTNVQAWDADLDTWAGKTAPSGTVLGTSDVQTLTNKRITKRTGTVASSATPTINTDNVDYFSITALATAITSMTTNLSGTPTAGQLLMISITDDGTARSLTFGASFEASTVPLPTTTVISTRLDCVFIWNEATSKWRIVGCQ